MELFLHRVYLPNGTHGTLSMNGQEICDTLEKGWHNNKRYLSCIPEGRYLLEEKIHPKIGAQLALSLVANRETILIIPANYSLHELQGCIVIAAHIVDNQPMYSRIAYTRVIDLIYPVLDAGEEVFLTIKSVK